MTELLKSEDTKGRVIKKGSPLWMKLVVGMAARVRDDGGDLAMEELISTEPEPEKLPASSSEPL